VQELDEAMDVATVDVPRANATNTPPVNAALLPTNVADAAEERLRLGVQRLRPPVCTHLLVLPFVPIRRFFC
jgi:hypothetical protein